MRAHYLQHVSFEGLGFIRKWLQNNCYQVSGTHFFENNYDLPEVDRIDALIILGGPMSVFDDNYQWMQEEKEFIRKCLNSGKKVLGICLGAQLMAFCLGANVYKAANPEIGWYPVDPTIESKSLPWFATLFAGSPTVFHWHGDMFDIPSLKGISLLSSNANRNQAFSYGNNALGLQFHLEVNQAGIDALIKNCSSDLIPSNFVQDRQLIWSQEFNIITINDLLDKILNNFFDQ